MNVNFIPHHPKAAASFKTLSTMYLFHIAIEGKPFSKEELTNFEITDELVHDYTAEFWQTETQKPFKKTGLTISDIYSKMQKYREQHADDIAEARIDYATVVLHKRFPEHEYKEVLSQNHCAYCDITIEQIEALAEKKMLFKKNERGWSLEMDRKNSNKEYTKDNCVMSCYWCNNAKTDEFAYEEFLEVGKAIGAVWKKRLG
ncbi:MAG: hypothetical protein JJU02_00865 [Cryomorphaceae bacterium]|nr:hypothetical protein [Cryomorphaceae bacterium]